MYLEVEKEAVMVWEPAEQTRPDVIRRDPTRWGPEHHRAEAGPAVTGLSSGGILGLQRAAGNGAVQLLMVQRNCGKVKQHMEENAVPFADTLYTGTEDEKFYQALLAFNGTLEDFTAAFMTKNKKQGQTAQMGAGIYATPNREAALGYGTYLVKIIPQANCTLLNLSDTKLTGRLRKLGVKPTQWAGTNPNCIVRFNGDYHVIKTNEVRMTPG